MKRQSLLAAKVAGAVVAFAFAASAEEKLDLNRATQEQLRTLPVPSEVAERIWEHREFVDWFTTVQDLLEVPGFTPAMLAAVRPHVTVEPAHTSERAARKDDLFYRFEWWEGSEGTDESLVELYKDLALDPVNVNEASILELTNLQNATPVDAVSVARYREQVGRIGNQSELRRAPGLTGWGYSNMRNFVLYEEPTAERDELHGAYSLRVETTDYFDSTEDLLRDDRDPGQGTNDNWWDRLELDNPEPAVSQKLALRYGRRIEAGAVTTRRFGEEDLLDTKKGFGGVRGVTFGPVHLDKLYVGNYQISWGQGVVMENTDFRSARHHGYSFAKRYDGILGDLSRTDEYALRGIATEARVGPVRLLGFWSDDQRDAILNDDGSVNLLIRTTPRIEDEVLVAAGLRPMRDVLDEKTFGGNLSWDFGYGRHVGVSGYESRYDRFFDTKWDPSNPTDKHPLIADDDEDNIVAQDSELLSSYESEGKFRRVYGLDFQWVYRNLALQGEYAELDKGRTLFGLGGTPNPSALVLNSWIQYENLNFLTVYRDYDTAYRDYDTAFDNPYQRSFSNYERFKGTIIEDYFRLEDPLYGFAFETAAQPQAERGFYINTRYQWAQPFTTIVEWDTWRRQGDMSRYSRFVGRLEYRILFPLRFKLRHKWQSRELDNLEDGSIFNNVETRIELEYRLSRFDQLEFLYATSYTQWPPRGRLQGEPVATGLPPVSGNNAEPGWAFGGFFTHHFENRRLKVDGGAFVYDGFLWFFEKSTFRVADGNAFRSWVEVTDRVSDGLTVRLRYVRENELRNTAVDIRQFNDEVGLPVDAGDVKDVTNYFRIQADYAF